MKSITATELAAFLKLPDAPRLLDVREPEEFATGHAPGAINIPLGELPSRLDELPDTEIPVAVTCRGGGRGRDRVRSQLAASRASASRNRSGNERGRWTGGR